MLYAASSPAFANGGHRAELNQTLRPVFLFVYGVFLSEDIHH